MTPVLAQLIPSTISGVRILIGLAFPWIPAEWRLVAVLTAGVSDLIDGPISRWLKSDGRFGQLLDPIADKIFLLCVLITVVMDGSVAWWELILIGGRDLAIFLVCVVLLATHGRNSWQEFRPRVLGKATTVLQIAFVLALLGGLETLTRILLPVTAVVGMLAVVDYCIAYRANLFRPQTLNAEPGEQRNHANEER